MKIKFLGAAGMVTGSKYLLSTSKNSYLVDCGLFQGLKELRQKNWQEFEVSPEQIKAIFLTHAHIDHSGYIPRLIKMGFTGTIYCSKATYDLVKILLPDSGHLQEEDARYANKEGYSEHKPALPLYTRQEAENALAYFQPLEFHNAKKINNEVKITLSRAGHILGASCILVEVAGRKIAFSGDVGRFKDLIMKPPEPLFDADYLVLEATYGDRDHVEEDLEKRIADIINHTIKSSGTVVIPAFAVGRTQHVLYLLHKLKAAKRIPNVDTYLDSPMATDTTELYCTYANEHRLSRDQCHTMSQSVMITKTTDESRTINHKAGPKIVISASGMASGGRILHHLAQYISNEKNVVMIVGFQAPGTRGRALLDGAKHIKIFGKQHDVRAKIEYIAGLSAHADHNELIRWLNDSPIKHPQVFLTHGEPSAAQALALQLQKTFHWQVKIPKDKEEFDL